MSAVVHIVLENDKTKPQEKWIITNVFSTENAALTYIEEDKAKLGAYISYAYQKAEVIE